jgi:hypothetical protein
MLNGLHLKPVSADRGTELCGYQMFDRGSERSAGLPIAINKDHAGIYRSRSKGQGHRLPGMEPNPRTTHGICDGLLKPHRITSIISIGDSQQLVCQKIFTEITT